MSKSVTLKPRLSEKSYGLSKSTNTYVVDVPADANKHTVARAVAAQFNVEVEKVNMTTIPGKAKRAISRGGRTISKGNRSDIKKAYITLKKGQGLPFFEAVEEAEAAEVKAEEKAAKQAAKETK